MLGSDFIYDTWNWLYFRHLHEDEEIRFILDGSGNFDVRDTNECWIRIHMDKGDMIVLVGGCWMFKFIKLVLLNDAILIACGDLSPLFCRWKGVY